MFILMGKKMENQFLELELAKLLDQSVSSIHMFSALFLTVMDQMGTHKANDMVPSPQAYIISLPLP